MSKCHPGSSASVSASRGRKDNGKRQVKISFFSPVSAAWQHHRGRTTMKKQGRRREIGKQKHMYMWLYTYIHVYIHTYIYISTLNFSVLVQVAPLQSARFPLPFYKVLSKLVDWSCLHSLCIIRCLTWERLKMLTIDHLENIWVNYNNSLTWIKAIWGWFPLLTT